MRDLERLRCVFVVGCFLMLPAVLHAEGGARGGGEDAESSSLFMQEPLEPPVRGIRIGGWRRYTTFAGFGGVGEHPVRAAARVTYAAEAALRWDGIRRDHEFRTVASGEVQRSSAARVAATYGSTFAGAPTRSAVAAGLSVLAGRWLALGLGGRIENEEARPVAGETYGHVHVHALGPALTLYLPGMSVSAGVGFGVRKIESFSEERVDVVERRVIEVRHGFALHGGRYLGYSHEVELRATGEQGSVLVTRAALEVAPSTVVSIVASVGYEVDAPKSARAARTFVSSLGVLLTPVHTVSVSILPGLRAPEVGTVTPVITLGASMRY